MRSVFCELDSFNIDKVDTVYIGGGTPTSLCDDDFESLLKKASSYLSSNYEFTVEANVENLSDTKLEIMSKYGVNRLSIGVESTKETTLKLFNRHHTFLEAQEAIKKAREHRITNINVDLIYGYKGQTIDDLKEDLDNLIKLDTPHISIYSLTIHKGTMMGNNKLQEQNQDDSRLFYDAILATMRRHSYTRYEISNFAKPGFESKHNQTYWKNKQYYGIGLGASGYVGNIRYTNTKNLNEYCSGHYIKESETVNDNDFLEYYIMLNLRLEKGFNREEFKELFNYDLYEAKKAVFDRLIVNDLCVVDENIRLTDNGLIIMDSILLDLLD